MVGIMQKYKYYNLLLGLLIIIILAAIIMDAMNGKKMESLTEHLYEITTECSDLQIDIANKSMENESLIQEMDSLELDIASLHAELEVTINELQEYRDQVEEIEYRKEWYRDIPLDDEYQIYIYEKCKELGLDYELALAKIMLESQFDPEARGYNKDENNKITSTDYGLMQINSGNLKWCLELAGRDVDVVNNVYDNIECGLLIYKYYQDYWIAKGYSDYALNVRALNSYNRGINGYLNYISNGNSWDSWRYAKLVYRNYNDIID